MPLECLNKLAILDLSDNPLTTDLDYKHFAIYYLNPSYALDGKVLTEEDVVAATKRYFGVYTVYEFLRDHKVRSTRSI
jgi:hypothetical protein